MKRLFLPVAIAAAFMLVAVGLLLRPAPAGSSHPQRFSEPAPSPATPAAAAPGPSRSAAAPSNAPVVPVSSSTAAEPAERPAALVAFAAWANQFAAGQAAVSVPQGEALAWKRREAMRELIQTDPVRALALAAPFAWRSVLPASITRHFEQRVDGRGELNVAVASDFERGKTATYHDARIGGQRYQAFVYGRRLTQVSQPDLPLHGIALDGKLAVLAEPVRQLEPGEAEALDQARGHAANTLCGICGQPVGSRPAVVAADLGGEVARFCGPEHLRLVSERWQLAETGGPGLGGGIELGATSASWSLGPKSVLYLRVNFPDDLTEPISEAGAYAVMDGVNDFYTEGSYNQTALTTTVAPLVTLPQTKAWYSTAGPGALLDDARETTRRAGYDTDNYDLDIVALTSVPDYDWGGLGYVHGKGTWLQSTGVGVTAHELGHNYGLMHGNFWNTATNSSILGPGANAEYGNIFDTMGAASAGRNHFNAFFKQQLGWLPGPAVHTVTSNGVYRIYPFDVPERVNGRFYAAQVRKDFDRDYWLEFRQLFPGNPWLQNGILLNWSPWNQSKGGTDLLDTTPGTLTGSGSREDAALVIGRTFSDPAAGVHFTPLARGATGTNAWLEVQITLAASPSNRPPVLAVEVELTNAAPGSLVHLHATATDPDGDALAYAWSFENLTFSTNNLPWIAQSWPAPGEHVVRCVVSDQQGGSASANAIVTVGVPETFRIQGRVTDLAGRPLEGVRVDNGATNLASSLGGFTDSDGRYVIVGVTSDLDLNAVKYGFTITNADWSNPITVTASVPNVDFVAVPLPTVTVTATTNAVPETSNETNFLLLTRTGDLASELKVLLNLSGSATVSNDYDLDLVVDPTNTFVIFPPDSNQVAIAFQTRNDTRAEGPETATLTVWDDPAYVVARFGEATITILDDDLPVRPAVAVTAPTAAIEESGRDSGVFICSRTGSTDSELIVNFTVGGTATAGTDYPTLLGVVAIPVGSRSATVRFQPMDDTLVEPDETVTVAVAPNAAYTVSGAPAKVTIVDDDLLTVTICPTEASAAEPTKAGRFTIKRDGDLSANLVVGYTVSGTATSGTDYQLLSGAATIPAGAASTTIVVTPLDDSLVEGDETVTLTLTNSAGCNIGTPGSATLVIRDNEKVTVTVEADDDEAAEPGSDTGLFTVSRGAVKNGALAVFLAISGTALNGGDYVPLDNVVVIPDGASAVTLEVIPFDDLHLEYTEDVILTLVPDTNYLSGSPGRARVTLKDDDDNAVPAVGFTFSASSAVESESPGVSVSLSHTSAVPVTVDYRVLGGTAASNDFTLPPPPLTFAPGARAKSLELAIKNNSLVNPNRTIRLVLFNPTGATLDDLKLHTYTILDDDPATVSVTAPSAAATETGSVAGRFRIARTGGTNTNLVVNFQVTGTASAPSDYAPLGTSVTLPAGVTYMDLPVVPVDDRTVEFAETVVLTLISAPGGRIVAPQAATVAISDNDPDLLPVVTVTATNRPYAVEGGAPGEFVFSRSRTNGALTLGFTLGGTAGKGVDYEPLANVITFLDGQASVTLPVVAIDDALIEGEETVLLSVTVGDAYRVTYPTTALLTIQDNDQRVRLDASDFLAAEPGTDTGEFTFTRFGTTNTDLRVFFTISGTASNGVDYAALSNSFIIPAGELSAVLPLLPLDDALVEGAETVTLTLTANAGYSLGPATTGTVTIRDDEPMITLIATVTNVVEGSGQPGVFTLTRTGDPKYDLTVWLAIGGTATYGVDYPPFLTNVYFSCGVTAIDLWISPTNELLLEGAESVTAALVPSPAYTILSPSNDVLFITDANTNHTPLVTITSPTVTTVFLPGTNVNLILEANAVDDGDTNLPLTFAWTNVSGPDTLAFSDSTTNHTTVSFTNVGVYVLRLTADDGQLQGFAEVTVVVGAVELLSTNLLHWAFEEGGGTNVLDTSGAGHGGVLEGAPAWVTNGALGGALDFAGTNDAVRATNSARLLEGLDAFSLSLWIKPANTNLEQGIFTAAEAGTNATLSIITRAYASCGRATNVIEATVATTAGVVRHISTSNATTSDWQHLVLTWSNGLAPALFINGKLDQPLASMVAVAGVLTNCPQFLIGRGPVDGPPPWQGAVDEVRVFPRALSVGEVGALAALPPTNYGARVDAGPDLTVQLITPAVLAGVVEDDGQPVPPGALSNTWSFVRGPAPVTLTNATGLTNTVLLPQAGEYVFRLVADDGQVKVFDDVTVTVIEPTLVEAVPTDTEAAELGPDPATVTFMRNGDTNVELTVFLTLTGTASNGVDCVELTNVLTFPAGSDTVALGVTPFLDNRTEGDETLILTVVSNAAYSIGNGTVTVTIHDSPYGIWNIARFTLEELTDPRLSSEAADFDRDGLVNFAEYALNRDPKSAETNAPLGTALELNPADGQLHITLSYTRRLPPTDVGYELAISNDLWTWSTGTNAIAEFQATDDGNGLTETVKARVTAPWSTATNTFLTLRVRLQTTQP